MTLTRQFVRVDTSGPDEEGCLIFDDDRLVAVMVKLSADSGPELAGRWFLEQGFGALHRQDHGIFDDLEAAERWIAAYRGSRAPARRRRRQTE